LLIKAVPAQGFIPYNLLLKSNKKRCISF